MGSDMKGTGMYLTERGSDGISFSFAVMWTSLFCSNSLNRAGRGIKSVVSKSVSLSTLKPRTSFSVKKGEEGPSRRSPT